jgi:tRNA nucleotidyltransferase (CCA-adding enzyme)
MRLLTDIVESLPQGIKELISEIINEEFVLTLVGGSVRDFVINQDLGYDLDFELTAKNIHNDKEWTLKLNSFCTLLERLEYKVVKSDLFNVYKINFEKYSLEFASARTEYHQSKVLGVGHSDVDVKFHSVIDPKLSFKRRDFTCNAIGVTFIKNNKSLQGVIVDPYNGLGAIKDKLLIPCGEDFIYDPVRFLRAIRFQIKLNFTLSEKLCDYLRTMNLEHLTNFYYLSEGFKVGFIKFSYEFFELVGQSNVAVSKRILELNYLSNYKDAPVLLSKEEVMDYLISVNLNKVQLEYFREFTGMKKSDMKERAKSARR